MPLRALNIKKTALKKKKTCPDKIKNNKRLQKKEI